MLSRTTTVSFQGIDTIKVTVEVQVASGLPAFKIVGLADKSVAESSERVRGALTSMGLALPAKRITVNLAPADVTKDGSHFDLPIAVGLLSAMGIIPPEEIENYVVLGELGLGGEIAPVAGVLPAAMAANQYEKGIICPKTQGAEALWSGNTNILPVSGLLEIINHFKGVQIVAPPEAMPMTSSISVPDFKDVKGQETAKRAMEIAAAGGHNLLMIGPPGSGKSMLASRFAGILPPLSTEEILQISVIHSVAGLLKDGELITTRPFRSPHHSASMPALVGGGLKAKPGEISLAHNGVLFLDELPEFSRQALEALRQPMESHVLSVARVNNHVTYPAKFQLIAAMNPCPCGYFGTPGHECARAPRCAEAYQSKISGPLFDRIDIHVDVPAVLPFELTRLPDGESSEEIRNRVLKARQLQANRYIGQEFSDNAHVSDSVLQRVAALDDEGRTILEQACEKFHLSARGYHRILRVSRMIADLAGSENISAIHIKEALSFRRIHLKEK